MLFLKSSIGFNLNLLECKCEYVNAYVTELIVLISTYWNVNPRQVVHDIVKAVLISTYWNVNHIRKIEDWANQQVLISTYWNVN